MATNRRKFLSQSMQGLGVLGLAQSFTNKSFEENYSASAQSKTLRSNYRGAVSLAQGMTNNNSAQFVLVIKAKQAIGYQAVDQRGKLLPIRLITREERRDHDYAVEKFMVSGLETNQLYRLQIIDAKSGKLIDERNFKALNLNLKNPKFIVGSCMNDVYTHGRDVMYDALMDQNPDIIFFVGDTVYADNWHAGDEVGFWDRYIQARLKYSFFRQKNLCPTLATWDDHDFGVNNGDTTFVKKEWTKQIFDLFWGWEEVEGLNRGVGVSSRLEAFNQRFYLMDDRYFRDKSGSKTALHWGQEQQDQLLESLSLSKAPAWLLNGSQFWGGYLGKESFERDNKENFKQLLVDLSEVESPIVFASGDVHFSEIMKIEPELLGYETFEYTSSSIHSITFPGHQNRKKNPRRLESTSAHNFLVFQSTADLLDASLEIKTESRGKDSDLYFSHDAKIKRG